jgi:hypothetical protein
MYNYQHMSCRPALRCLLPQEEKRRRAGSLVSGPFCLILSFMISVSSINSTASCQRAVAECKVLEQYTSFQVDCFSDLS